MFYQSHCSIPFSFCQIQVLPLAPAPLTHLYHRPVPVPCTSWVGTPKLADASLPAVSPLPHWPASHLLSLSPHSVLHLACPTTPSPCRVSMARHCPLPLSLVILFVPAVQNRHAHHSSREFSQQRSSPATSRQGGTMETGRHTAPAATPWRCLCLKERGWRTWRGTRQLASFVLVSTAAMGCVSEGREVTRTQPAEAASSIAAPPHRSTVVATTTPKRWW